MAVRVKTRRYIGMIAVSVAALALLAWGASPYWLSVLNVIGLYTVVAVGLSLLMGYAGQVSLGHAGFYGMGAYVAAVLSTRLGWNGWLTLPAAVLLTMAVAWVVGRPAVRLREHYLAMATLGLGMVFHIVMVEWEAVTGGSSGIVGIPALAVGPWTVEGERAWLILTWGAAAMALAMAYSLVTSPIGRALRAISGSEAAAEALGIPASRYKLAVFVLSAGFAGLAGALYAFYVTFVSPSSFGVMMSIQFVMMVVVGGGHRLWGAPAGAATLVLLGEGVKAYLPALLPGAGGEVQLVFYGLLLIAILLLKPDGVLTGWATWRRKRSGEHARAA